MFATPPTPTLYVFAGPPGAGKTTFARAFLKPLANPPRFLNADNIAHGLSPLGPQNVAVKSGDRLLDALNACIESRVSLALECTLARASYFRPFHKAKYLGYQIEVHYLWIPSPELAIARIAQRVKKGGQAVPDAEVRRDFSRSFENLIHIYGPLAETWQIWSNRTDRPRLIVASGSIPLSKLDILL